MTGNRRGTRGVPFKASPKNAAGLSDYRRDQLGAQTDFGIVKEGGTNYDASKINKKSATAPAHSGPAAHVCECHR